ncbi:MAG: phenylalanine--tRNA ligase subunit beta, partial [Candidatus Sungbacteria bacterium]|nr:phenylalanine--tRNA ligase subunit beta [Candidatus Sungbacteria bacterium]
IAIAGIKGGKHSGVTSRTGTIVLESANFDPVRTRLASRALNLKTDASYRFEHGLDPSATERAIDRLAEVIQRAAGGEILAGRVDAYPRRSPVIRLPLRTDYANRIIGQNIPLAFYETGLRRLGWDYRRKGRADFTVTPPPERLDIRIEEDIIEEIARLWGYEKIPAKAPHAPLAPAAANEERQWEERVRDVLVGAGLAEVFAYEFVSRKILDDFAADAKDLLELENPVSPETQYLIAHPAQRYIRIASENLRHFDAVGIFGLAKGFRPAPTPSTKTPSEERKYLVITKGAREPKSSKDSGETFYAVKGAIDQMFESLGISDHWYDDVLTKDERQKAKALHPYRTAKVMVGDEFLGVVAEVHPSVLKRLKSRGRIVFAEISFEKLWRMSRAEAEFRPVGRFPAVVRDIAVIVPENTKTEAVTNVIESAGGTLLADSDLFDYFQDEAMEERGEKSLAFHLVFQSPERTLTDEEVNRLYQKIITAVEEKGWEVRR